MSGAWRWDTGGRRVGVGAEDGTNAGVGADDRMLTLLKRHQVQTLLAAGHDHRRRCGALAPIKGLLAASS